MTTKKGGLKFRKEHLKPSFSLYGSDTIKKNLVYEVTLKS